MFIDRDFFSFVSVSHCPLAMGFFSELCPDVQNITWGRRAVIVSPFITTSAPYLPASPTFGSSNEVPSVFELLGMKSSKAGWRQGWEPRQQGHSSSHYGKQLQLWDAAAICISDLKRSLSVRADGRSGCRHHLPGFAGWWQLETLSSSSPTTHSPSCKTGGKNAIVLKIKLDCVATYCKTLFF